MRTKNVQVRKNVNSGHGSEGSKSSSGEDYTKYLDDGRETDQPTWEDEAGLVHQNDMETVTKHYTVDYLSTANRDIMVTADGQYTQRYVYDEDGTRISAEFGYAEGTNPGEGGENPASDIAVNSVGKVWYRTNMLGSTLFAVDADGEVVSHTIYDPWGDPLTDTETDMNRSGLDNCNNYTGYTWDEVLGLYFAQNRFYDAETHRFTQEDPAQDGSNWYAYCENNPLIFVDPYGLSATRGYYSTLMCADSTGYNDDIIDMSSLMSYVNKLDSGWSSRLADWSMDLSDWSMDLSRLADWSMNFSRLDALDLSGLNSTCSELNDIFNSAEWTTLMNMPHNYINFNYGNLNSELNALNKNLGSMNIKLNAVGNAGKQVQAIGIDMSAFNAYFKPITAPTYTASTVLDGIQTGLDVFGLVPGPGEIADGVNAGIYLLRGDYVNAGLSLFSCLPFAGWFGTGGKLAKKGIKAVDAVDDAADAVKGIDNAVDAAKGAGKVGAIQTYYPPKSGFLGEAETTTLKPGTIIDRYGSEFGNYASPVGTPAEMRALPPGMIEKTYNVYEVVKPVDALSGQIAPWFGQPGLGTQYKFNMTIEQMLKEGIIK